MDQPPARRQRSRRRWLRVAVWLVFGPLLAVAALNLWVLLAARGRAFSPAALPAGEKAVALVLGTSKKRENGQPNLHYERRMDAAAALWKAGKAQHFLVSGAVDGAYYNEPRDMTDSLVARGVPAAAISRDDAGFRTLDSMVRAREVFGLRRCLVVSDGWHVPRAMFIARHAGLEATGIAAAELPLSQSIKARSREWLARVLVVFDLYFLHTQPARPTPTQEEKAVAGRLRG